MDYKPKVGALLEQALKSAATPISKGAEELAAVLETPKDSKMGDLAFPTFSLAKELRKAPPLIAKELLGFIAKDESVAKVEAVGPYLNFYLNKGELAAKVINAILEGGFTARRALHPERVMVEYSQPNTHKAFHVGHVRCASLGDSVVRILDWNGYDVIPVNYLGDEGTHVAKCLWYYRTHFKGAPPTDHRGEFLGELYSKATLLLDLSLMTRAPVTGVAAAKVSAIRPIEGQKNKWHLTLETSEGPREVVCGATGYTVGDLVPWAKPGAYIKDRKIGAVEKWGIVSVGMVCSEEEIKLSEEKKVPVLPAGTPLGTEVAEIYRNVSAVPDGESVLGLLREREREVSEVLQAMERKDPAITALWQETKQWSMDELFEVYDWLNCRFDRYFFESEFGEEGKRLVREYQNKGVFVESDGAIGADLKQWGLGFCLLIKRDGTALYATRDLALAERKFKEFKIDRSIYVVDVGQTLHFQQVFKCLELMGYPQAKQCYHLPYGIVTLPDGKMSSRKGNVILFSQLQDRLVSKINAEFLEKYRGIWPDQELHTAAHRIALATMRYGMLNQDNNSNIVFDLDAWTSKTGNTGPYMLYAYARIKSILRELGEIDRHSPNYALLTHESEMELLSHLNSYHHALAIAGENKSALAVCSYVYELAKKFSRMYQNCSVKNAPSEDLRKARAGLVEATGTVISHALGLLGILTLERM